MDIRPFRRSDTPVLARFHHRARRLPQRMAAGAQVWVAAEGKELLGYVSLSPVPGLPGVVDLDCFVAPEQRRQGVGSTLLQHVIRAGRGTEIGQLSHAVSSLESEAAHFLQAHGFYLEHEEWWLERGELDRLPPLALPQGCHLQRFARPDAIGHFRALYEQSFGGTPWYQPYTATEVAAELDNAADLLFLVCAGEPAGFAWMRLGQGEIGMIEPFGIAATFQGRGCGRALLHATLHQLSRRGVKRVRLGLWRRNQAALALYRSEGFRHTSTRYYLALDL